MKQQIGVTFTAKPGQPVTGVYEADGGAEVFETDDPYLLYDGRSLASPLPVFDAGGPVFLDDMGNAQAALAVSGLTHPIDWNWQQFSMTSGDSGEWIGYSNGDIAYPPFNPPVGLIDRQPTTVTDLIALFQDVGSGDMVAVFNGTYGEALQLIVLSIGGFALTPAGWSELAGNTWLRFGGLPGNLIDGEIYDMQFGP